MERIRQGCISVGILWAIVMKSVHALSSERPGGGGAIIEPPNSVTIVVATLRARALVACCGPCGWWVLYCCANRYRNAIQGITCLIAACAVSISAYVRLLRVIVFTLYRVCAYVISALAMIPSTLRGVANEYQTSRMDHINRNRSIKARDGGRWLVDNRTAGACTNA